MTKTALITGATSGIGLSTARLLAKNGFNLILTGRREDRLNKISSELSALGIEVQTLVFDVRDRDKVAAVLNALTKTVVPDVLINNAGNAHGLDPIHDGNIDDWDMMMDINVKGLLYVSRAIIPYMVKRNSGHIINIGSLAGKEVYPNGNVYCGSKHAVDAITKGMRMDLNKHGIKVAAVNPGLVETEFSEVRFKGDTARAKGVYAGYSPLTPNDVADIILFMITRPPHVNIADVLLLPTDQASSTIVNK